MTEVECTKLLGKSIVNKLSLKDNSYSSKPGVLGPQLQAIDSKKNMLQVIHNKR